MLNLNELRTHFHLKRFMDKQTLEDVAKETGVSASTLYRFEQNKTVPQLEQLEAIIDWLGMELILRDKAF